MTISDDSLYRMFTDREYSSEQRELVASVYGKTVDECRADFAKVFKMKFLFDKRNHLFSVSLNPCDSIVLECKLKPMLISETDMLGFFECHVVAGNSVEMKQTSRSKFIDSSLNNTAQKLFYNTIYEVPDGYDVIIRFFNGELTSDEILSIYKYIQKLSDNLY